MTLDNDTPKEKATSSRDTKKSTRMTRLKRQSAIQELILLDGMTKPSEIERTLRDRGYTINRNTIGADIEHMMYDDEFWLQALTKSVWVAECRNQYLEVKKDIKDTRELIDFYTKQELEGLTAEFNWPENPYKPHDDAANYLKYENIRAKAYGAFMRKYSKGVEIAQLRNAVTKNREWLQQFIKDLPLYWKLKQLANWVETNKPKDEHLISAPVPEMEVEQTAK